MYQPENPDPDVIVRTAGEMRLSNFMIYQAAYAELVVTPVTWPEFKQNDLFDCIADFQNRERKFGGLEII
jgi:undecaprenyl diphosphate synthase